jgi:hypothetical protein
MVVFIEILVRSLVIFAGLSGVGYLLVRENSNARIDNVIRLPKTYFYISVCCGIIFLGFVIALIIWTDLALQDRIAIYLFSLFLVLCIWMVVLYYNFKIEFDGNNFTYTTFLRKSYTYDLRHVWIRYQSNSLIIIKAGKKSFFIDPDSIGIEKLLNRIYRNKPM